MGATGRTRAASEASDLERNSVFDESMMRNLNPTNPLRIITVGAAADDRSRSQSHRPHPLSTSVRHEPTREGSNSRSYTNRSFLFLFIFHAVSAVSLGSYLIFKGVQWLIEGEEKGRNEKRLLQYFLPQAEAALLLSVLLAFSWQKAVREWPNFMVRFILWGSFSSSLAAGILLLCFQKPATDGLGVAFLAFSVGNGLYACSVVKKMKFSVKVLVKSFAPVSKFPDLNLGIYGMMGAGFVWVALWILAVLGAVNFYFPPLVIILLVLSLAWTVEVMRNVANLTASGVIATYYLRGMQASAKVCFRRAITENLGSACLGSLFVPAIEALRIIARALNLLQGEDEFMFSCAHCCLGIMDIIFRYGNAWAFVHVAAHAKTFVRASQDTWELFERQEMEVVVDSDITNSLCFLAGVSSGCVCVIVSAAWTAAVHARFVATISLLAFFVGYLMTRIAMAVPHACVSCYYVCYAENPSSMAFENDKTIPDKLNLIKSGRDVVVPTPRVPRRFR